MLQMARAIDQVSFITNQIWRLATYVLNLHDLDMKPNQGCISTGSYVEVVKIEQHESSIRTKTRERR